MRSVTIQTKKKTKDKGKERKCVTSLKELSSQTD